jgi:hypothetical protein
VKEPTREQTAGLGVVAGAPKPRRTKPWKPSQKPGPAGKQPTRKRKYRPSDATREVLELTAAECCGRVVGSYVVVEAGEEKEKSILCGQKAVTVKRTTRIKRCLQHAGSGPRWTPEELQRIGELIEERNALAEWKRQRFDEDERNGSRSMRMLVWARSEERLEEPALEFSSPTEHGDWKREVWGG